MTEFIDGLDELELNLGRVDDAVSDAGLLKALGAGALVIEGKAKEIAHEKDILDTGFLIGAIQAQSPTKTPTGAEVFVGSAADYSKHHEFGTSKMAARPYMRPAIKQGGPSAQKAVSAVLKIEIDNAIR